MKRLSRRWPLASVTDPDRLLGSYLLKFFLLASFLLGPLIMLRCCLPWTRLLAVSIIFITADTWKGWHSWSRWDKSQWSQCQEVAKCHEWTSSRGGQVTREGVGYRISTLRCAQSSGGPIVEVDWVPDRHGSQPWPRCLPELLQEAIGDKKVTRSLDGSRLYNWWSSEYLETEEE